MLFARLNRISSWTDCDYEDEMAPATVPPPRNRPEPQAGPSAAAKAGLRGGRFALQLWGRLDRGPTSSESASRRHYA